MKNNPLVSVVVITYNSSKTVIETLDSIAAQTYQNIELIVTDDCSVDDTLALCMNWKELNITKLVSIKVISTHRNLGVSGNLNHGISQSNGVWIKCVAGDDTLPANSIERYVNFVKNNENCKICFAKMFFMGEDMAAVESNRLTYEKRYYPIIKQNIKTQYRNILKMMFVPGPGLFFKKNLWESIGGFNENYPMMEEWPFTCKVLESGNRIYFIDDYLVNYRIGNSLSRSIGQLPNYNTFKGSYDFFIKERRSKMLKHGMIMLAWHQTLVFYFRTSCYRESSNNINPNFMKYVLYLSPITYYSIAKTLISKVKKLLLHDYN